MLVYPQSFEQNNEIAQVRVSTPPPPSITWELPPGLPPEKIDDWWLAGGRGLIVGMGFGGLRAYFLGAGFGG